MDCAPVNRTPEEIRNAFINKNFLWDVNPDDPLELIIQRLDFLQEHIVLPEGENQTYWMDGYNIKERVSNLSKKSYEDRSGKRYVKKEIEKLDFIKQKNVGTRVHNVLAEIMDFKYNNKGNLDDIKARAAKGDYAVSNRNFNVLANLIDEHIELINRVQQQIGPGKAIIRVEQKMVSPLRDVGGALDVVVVFTDKTMGRIDYKTAHSHRYNYNEGKLTDELLTVNKVTDYELAMNEYGKILKEDIGLKGDRLVLLSPIHLRLKMKPDNQRGSFDIYTTEIDFIEAGSKISKYLKPIPISGYKTSYKGVDKLLEKQWILLAKKTKELQEKTLSTTDREATRRTIKALRKSIQTTIIDGDISDILESVEMLSKELYNRMHEPELLEGGKFNPKYLTDEDLKELVDELSLYKDIIGYTHKYYGDLKAKDEKLYEKLRDGIMTASSNVLATLATAKVLGEERLFETLDKYIGDSYKDADGNPLPLEELGYGTRNFTRMSEMPHYMFKAAWKMVEEVDYKMLKDLKALDEEIESKEKALFTWAKSNNMSRQAAFDMIINFNTGQLISNISKELMERIDKAYSISNSDLEKAYQELSSIYELKDKEKFLENYQARLERYKETQVHKHKLGKEDSEYKRDIAKWIKQNNLLTSKEAWVNEYNRTYHLRIRANVKEANPSPEYKRMSQIKPLFDFYNMLTKYNNEFRKILDIADIKKLPPNFIAYIRKDMIDTLSMDKMNIFTRLKAVGKEFLDSFSVREEEVFLGDVDETGKLKRNIPILYTNPFLNKDDEIDNTRRSYDLGKNLLLFAKMAYNYKYMHEIEPTILKMREYMADPSAEREGTIVTTKSGNKIRGKMSQWLTKVGLDTETYKVFEKLTDYHLYGIKFTESIGRGGKVDIVKTILNLKQYYSKSTLGLAFIPAIGAYIASAISKRFMGNKGISYNNKHMDQSNKHMITDFQKYMGISVFYDVYSTDPTSILIDKRSANLLPRIMTTNNLMYPLRKADELLNNSILNAMVLNWGIDIEGKLGRKNALVRLNAPSIDATGIPTIWDLSTFNTETGKMEIKGLTDENYLQFREAVRSTSHSVIGSLSQRDISMIDANLLFNVMFQFRSWMPGIFIERSGKLIYDDKLQAAKWGRYRAAFAELGITDHDFKNGFVLKQYMSKIFLPNVAKFTLDLFTFGFTKKMGITSSEYTDQYGRTKKIRSNINRAKRMYRQHLLDNPELMGKMTFEEFLEVKEGQMRAFTNELRAILAFAILIHLMGAGDDGEEPPYMASYFSRLVYKNFTKAQSELTFMWDPRELMQMFRSPIPMTGLLVRSISTVSNGLDETRDLLQGENSLSDKTPIGYWWLQWIYGASQTARFIELFDQYQKSPYANKAIR